ncbi:hypothetical protein P154DRAFT_527074 [Amniculicola lignicola CBS 123094]|uniref:Uncharacterized protein n=1 Tax=Amniculicola lignicola CBS 123094 TaxID=1392246 RepID=A0A6A5W5N9_9PLEO|nr:hypothetical protein P154DRAFT_527074 [Amniculicola lignicola CBS 123094]
MYIFRRSHPRFSSLPMFLLLVIHVRHPIPNRSRLTLSNTNKTCSSSLQSISKEPNRSALPLLSLVPAKKLECKTHALEICPKVFDMGEIDNPVSLQEANGGQTCAHQRLSPATQHH